MNSNIGEKIKELRIKKGLTQVELGKKIGVKHAAIHKYEKGIIENITTTKLQEIADALDVPVTYLLGMEDDIQDNHPQGKNWIPVLGTIRAGIPITAVEEILDYEEIPEAMARNGEHFALQIKGNSMEPKFSEGDVVIVRKQPTIENNEIGIVLVNGDEATIKKVSFFKGGLNLIPLNAAYETRTYTTEEIESLPVEILGKVVELRAKF